MTIKELFDELADRREKMATKTEKGVKVITEKGLTVMTVKELIGKLSELPPDLEVLIAEDEEGNAFHPVTEFSLGYGKQDGSSYKFNQEEYYDIDSETGESDYPGDNCIVLWPW